MSLIDNIGKAIAEGFTKNLEVSTVTVVLAGGSAVPGKSIRSSVRKELKGYRYVRGFDVLYPEELFVELLSRKSGRDLLTLESTLAESAHAIIIIVESPGSIAELGAFVNSEALPPKLIAVVDKKHRNDKSFIMLGPVAQLRDARREAVIIHDFKRKDIPKLTEDIRRVVRLIIKDTQVDDSLKNPIRAQYFLLASVFVAEPTDLRTLTGLLAATGECDTHNVAVVARTALNILMRQRDITMEANRYLITPKGLERLRDIIKNTKRGRQIVPLLDKCRVDILNATLRKSSRRILHVTAEGAPP